MSNNKKFGFLFTVLMVLISVNLPPMQGIARYEVYETAKIEYENFKEIRESGVGVPQGEYERVTELLGKYSGKYKTGAEVEMVASTKRLYKWQITRDRKTVGSKDYNEYEARIVSTMESLEMLFREYELK